MLNPQRAAIGEAAPEVDAYRRAPLAPAATAAAAATITAIMTATAAATTTTTTTAAATDRSASDAADRFGFDPQHKLAHHVGRERKLVRLFGVLVHGPHAHRRDWVPLVEAAVHAVQPLGIEYNELGRSRGAGAPDGAVAGACSAVALA